MFIHYLGVDCIDSATSPVFSIGEVRWQVPNSIASTAKSFGFGRSPVVPNCGRLCSYTCEALVGCFFGSPRIVSLPIRRMRHSYRLSIGLRKVRKHSFDWPVQESAFAGRESIPAVSRKQNGPAVGTIPNGTSRFVTATNSRRAFWASGKGRWKCASINQPGCLLGRKNPLQMPGRPCRHSRSSHRKS